ncbi:MAG: RNA-binding protein [Comamonas sp.]|jgi:RNA recognition motif-containing protein|uniref:RNA recognition motif domain-containing protein n=1 Tax=Comamonas sp. TaxID=34028 RepID=UPI0012CAA2D4|nr:RNA-binding protein [Comamonas sp.]MDR3066928.1 RNA-binding protein [Comamonas sp.]MPS96625.1 RNA-binding protein [Comamonas sp.]
MQSNLYVSNLGYGIDRELLKSHFSSCGDVLSSEVITDRNTGQSRGFGFVEMGTAAQAKAAIDALNDQSLGGRVISVSLANARK